VLVGLTVPAPALAGPPFVTDDPEPVELHKWEINLALTGTAAGGGGVAALPGVDANYGLAPELQLQFQPQLSVAWGASGTEIGVGDIELGLKYRFVREDKQGWRPMVAVFPSVTLPTGNPQRGLGSGNGQAFLPVWVEKNIGKWTLDGGAGYRIDPGADNRNAWFVGGLLLYQLTEKLQLGGELFRQGAELRGGKTAAGFNLGGSLVLTEEYNVLFSAGTGVANQIATDRFSGYLALQVAF
jgi:hypothetical protein